MTVDIENLEALAKAATQGDWQVIETELPCRLGRPHVERRVFTTKDHPQLKAPYPVVNGSVALGTDETQVHHMVSMTAEDAAYIAAANPAAVLELIDENEAMAKRILTIDIVHGQKAQLSWIALAAERDQLKAENEALRKDAERYRWLRDGAGYCDTRDIPGMAPARMDEFIDEAMRKEEQS